MTDIRILPGDCLHVLADMPDNSIDACVTDPPYGIEFMGSEWDAPWKAGWQQRAGFTKPGIGDRQTAWPTFTGDTSNPTCATCGGRRRGAKRCGCDEPDWRVNGEPVDPTSGAREMMMFADWAAQWGSELLRVLKPGAHALVFGGTRTFEWIAVGLQLAGFERRDTILAFTYGTGFPKSLNVSKAIDAHHGAERPVIGWNGNADPTVVDRIALDVGGATGKAKNGLRDGHAVTAAATDDVARWDGWGTALKPAYEPILVFRKPMPGTVAANVLRHGTGALNIDGCRVPVGGARPGRQAGNVNIAGKTVFGDGSSFGGGSAATESTGEGRWPANLVLVHHPDCREVGVTTVKANSQTADRPAGPDTFGGLWKSRAGAGHGQDGVETVPVWDCHPSCPIADLDAQPMVDGNVSRFFNTPRWNPELDDRMLWAPKPSGTERHLGMPADTPNTHPTLKPVELLRHLIRLITPPGGTVIDPFAGSGTTLVAAQLEGVNAVGIEQSDGMEDRPDYVSIIRHRVAFAARLGRIDPNVAFVDAAQTVKAADDVGQLDLFAAL